MNAEKFHSQVVEQFPELTDWVTESADLPHVVMGALYSYSLRQIAAGDWDEVNRVFRFLDNLYEPGADEAFENALRVSFLEYFDFGKNEKRIRRLWGPVLDGLYEDQMKYMEELSKKAAGLDARTRGSTG